MRMGIGVKKVKTRTLNGEGCGTRPLSGKPKSAVRSDCATKAQIPRDALDDRFFGRDANRFSED